MDALDDHILFDWVCTLDPRSVRHKAVLTTWLLAMQPDRRETFDFFLKLIGKRKWRIDYAAFRYLIKHGDGQCCLDVLTHSLRQFLSKADLERAWLKAYGLRKPTTQFTEVLSDVFVEQFIPHFKERKSVERFREHISMFSRHQNYRIRGRGILASMFLKKPDVTHFRSLKLGLRSRNQLLASDCLCALHCFFHAHPVLSKENRGTFQSLQIGNAARAVLSKGGRGKWHASLVKQFKRYGL